MNLSKSLAVGTLGLLAVLASNFVLADGAEWHFVVKNASASKITALEVSEDKKAWGPFDIGRGIAPGTTVTLVWDSSTDDDDCEQWIRAKFADGSASEPSQQDFCKDLDSPIEFSE